MPSTPVIAHVQNQHSSQVRHSLDITQVWSIARVTAQQLQQLVVVGTILVEQSQSRKGSGKVCVDQSHGQLPAYYVGPFRLQSLR